MRQCPFTGCLAGVDDDPATVCCPTHWQALTIAERNRCHCADADRLAGRISLAEARRLYGKVCTEAARRKKRRAG